MLSAELRFVLIFMSTITLLYVLRKISKSQIQIEDALFWVVVPFVLVILSIFPSIATWATTLIQIQAPVNFVFLAFIFILLMKLFLASIKISQMDNKINNLAQELALHNHAHQKNSPPE